MRPTDHPSRFENVRAILVSTPFIVALATLLANDFWLKYNWPGAVTGKLSDFAGIAVITWLTLALVKTRRWIPYGCIALAFTWWKSPLSQDFIDAVNALTPWSIARVVDFTDLIALAIMPLCGFIPDRGDESRKALSDVRRWMFPPVTVLTSLALMATSMPITREFFQVRQDQEDVSLNPNAIFSSVVEVTERHGLECKDCSSPQTGAVFAGKNLELRYTFEAPDTLRFWVYAGPGGFPFGKSAAERSDPLVGDLKRRLSHTYRGLVLTQKLDGEGMP